MSRHVAPHRWAELEAGRLGADEAARAERHAADCSRCAAARARIVEALAAMREIATDEPPELRWDQVGAQIYWTISSERRGGDRGRGWNLRLGVAVGAVAAVAAAVVAFATLRGDGEPIAAVEPPAPAAPEVTPPAPVAPVETSPVFGVVTLAQGDVRVDGEALDFDRVIGAGQTIATGQGRAVVQFDHDSVFAVGPNTTLELTSFDNRRVQLDVRGAVDVRLAKRPPEQRFAVGAGGRDVVVRGTVFRVVHGADSLEVACTRGRVSVVEDDESTDVRAGERLMLLSALASSSVAQPIAEEELAELEAALEVPMLPLWESARAVLDTTARLDIDAEPADWVEVDGIGVGRGALALRVAPGRHHIEGAGRGGEWIRIQAGIPAQASLPRVVAKRRKSVRAPQLDRALRERERALERCARSLAVHGIAEGSFVTLEIGVNRDGSQGFLNIVDSNVPAATARCVRDVVDGIALPSGPRETLRKRIPFE